MSQPDPAAANTSPIPNATPTQTLYFAYGSNLSPTQMHARCPGSPLVGVGCLSHARWFINTRGYANVLPLTAANAMPAAEVNRVEKAPQSNLQIDVLHSEQTSRHQTGTERQLHLANQPNTATPPENEVWGLVYALSPADETLLDGFEGVPSAYGKEWHDVAFWALQDLPSTELNNNFSGAASSNDLKEAATLNAELLAAADPFGPETTRLKTAPVELPTGRADTATQRRHVRALVYVDRSRPLDGLIREEYVLRMRRGMLEAGERGVPREWMDGVIGRWMGVDVGKR